MQRMPVKRQLGCILFCRDGLGAFIEVIDYAGETDTSAIGNKCPPIPTIRYRFTEMNLLYFKRESVLRNTQKEGRTMSDESHTNMNPRNKSLEEVLDDKKFLGHPRGVGALAAGNFFNSFAWGALYAILIFYLYSPYMKGLGFTQGQAASMIAAMGACNSIFGILGSWLADRVLGMRKALIIGNIVKGMAFGVLAIPAFL